MTGNGEEPTLKQKYKYYFRSEFYVAEYPLPTCGHYFIKVSTTEHGHPRS